MKRRARLTLYATPISLAAWFVAVCLIHGPDQLLLRAGYAIQVYLLELVLIGYVCLIHLILEKLWDFPGKSREDERKRRIREGRCLG